MEGIFLVPFAPFLFVLGIIWISKHHKLEEKRIAAAAKAREQSGGSAQHLGRIEELEDRVRVLERIVTDRRYDLASEIEALRDDRGVEMRLMAAESEVRV